MNDEDRELLREAIEAEDELDGAILASEAALFLMTPAERDAHFEFIAEREIDGFPAMLTRRLDRIIERLQGENQ